MEELECKYEVEEAQTQKELDRSDDDDDDDDDRYINEVAELDEVEQKEWESQIKPICLVLAKVSDFLDKYCTCIHICFEICKFAFKVVHSTTLLLPNWNEKLAGLKLSPKMIPWDVTIR